MDQRSDESNSESRTEERQNGRHFLPKAPFTSIEDRQKTHPVYQWYKNY